MCTDEAIVSNVDVTITIIDIIMGQDSGTECDDCVLPDMNSLRICFVELGGERNHGPFTEIHAPNANQVEATKPQHEVTQQVTYPGRQGHRGVTDGRRGIFPVATVKSVFVRHMLGYRDEEFWSIADNHLSVFIYSESAVKQNRVNI
jgi:hypothetical protein